MSNVSSQMYQPNELITSYAASGHDARIVRQWFEAQSVSEDMLCTLAKDICAAFLSKRIEFNTASGLFNQLMPMVGFNRAPKGFWEYYVAFENAETAHDPDAAARASVTAVSRSNES